MPFDLTGLASGILSVGANMYQNKANFANSLMFNHQQQVYNDNAYTRQRNDALADRDYQNEYNSPGAQMSRLKAAGLNPNLVYGNGNATASAAPVRSSDEKSFTPSVPRVETGGFTGAIAAYQDSQLKAAQVDNTKQAIEVAKQEALLKAVQIGATAAGTDMTKFDLGQKERLADVNAAQVQANLTKTEADTKFTLDKNEREIALNSVSVREAVQRILTSRLQNTKIPYEISDLQSKIRNLDQDTRLKSLDADLKATGVQPHDPLYQRAIAKYLSNFDDDSGLDAHPGSWSNKHAGVLIGTHFGLHNY